MDPTPKNDNNSNLMVKNLSLYKFELTVTLPLFLDMTMGCYNKIFGILERYHIQRGDCISNHTTTIHIYICVIISIIY